MPCPSKTRTTGGKRCGNDTRGSADSAASDRDYAPTNRALDLPMSEVETVIKIDPNESGWIESARRFVEEIAREIGAAMDPENPCWMHLRNITAHLVYCPAYN